MHERDFSLRTCRKNKAGTRHKDRDRQFRYLVRLRRLYLTLGLPVISVDTKKKEWVGDFKNPGRCWRRHDRDVLDHDFPSWASGQAIPVGVYDVRCRDGFVLVGTSHDTPRFTVAAVRRWWRDVGRHRYPGAKRLLIEADGGGATDHRKWGWKVALQEFADESGLIITVTHFPPGASKWNPVEHRLFSQISKNWAAEPLTDYDKILRLIRGTTTTTGLRVRAYLDTKDYPLKVKPSAKRLRELRITRHKILPKWNYTIASSNVR